MKELKALSKLNWYDRISFVYNMILIFENAHKELVTIKIVCSCTALYEQKHRINREFQIIQSATNPQCRKNILPYGLKMAIQGLDPRHYQYPRLAVQCDILCQPSSPIYTI